MCLDRLDFLENILSQWLHCSGNNGRVESRPSQPVSDRTCPKDTGWGSNTVTVGISGFQLCRRSTKSVGDKVNTCRSLPGFSLSGAAIPESLSGLSVPAD